MWSVGLSASPAGYPDHVPVGLRRDDLADQMRRFAGAFHLGDDVLHSTTVQSTSFDPDRKIWSVVVSPSGKTIVCKHLVLCTGIASSAPEVPAIPGREIYTGISIHSNDFNNGKELVARGVKASTPPGKRSRKRLCANGFPSRLPWSGPPTRASTSWKTATTPASRLR